MSVLDLPRRARAAARSASLAFALVLAVPASPLAHPLAPQGSTAAREQARLCERLNEEAGVEACRTALALGLGPERRRAVRIVLARHLVDLERWSELADHYREDVRLAPEDAGAWTRLGSTLLFALNERAEALAALDEAARLTPLDPSVRVLLALARHFLGRCQEATAAFDEALRLDPRALEGRPAAQAIREAARRCEPWPQSPQEAP